MKFDKGIMMRLPYFIASAFSLLLLLAGCESPEFEGPQPTRILMIGNSFSVSVMNDMPKIADSMSVDLDLTSLYIGGCSFKKHLDNVKRDWDQEHKPYLMTRSVRNKAKKSEKVNLLDVLDGEVMYDVITIQQASHESWDPKTYSAGDELVALVRKHQPQAKIYVQETWSYTPFDKRLAKWGFDQDEMYSRLHDAYAQFAKRHGLEIIPMGDAVQRWRKLHHVKYTDHSFGGDVVGGRAQRPEDQFKRMADNSWALNSDPFHLNEKGEYLQSLVWIAKIFHEDVTACEYVREGLDASEARLMKEIANEYK